jgi:hypothetical protein
VAANSNQTNGTNIRPENSIRIRDRIRELRRVRASELVLNPKNWRRHPKAQVDALRGLLAEIGYADALLARELVDGRLMLIDGHLRAETTPDAEVPVLVLRRPIKKLTAVSWCSIEGTADLFLRPG